MSGLNAMNFIHSVHLNCLLPKRVSLPKVPWEAVGLSVTYASIDLGSSPVRGHSVNQVCGSYHHFILAPHWSLPLSPSHSLFNIIGYSWSLGVPCFCPWSPWPSGLHLLFHSLKDGVATILHGFFKAYICTDLPAQLNGPPKPNAMFLALQ